MNVRTRTARCSGVCLSGLCGELQVSLDIYIYIVRPRIRNSAERSTAHLAEALLFGSFSFDGKSKPRWFCLLSGWVGWTFEASGLLQSLSFGCGMKYFASCCNEVVLH